MKLCILKKELVNLGKLFCCVVKEILVKWCDLLLICCDIFRYLVIICDICIL